MAGTKGKSGGANNTKPQRGELKKRTNITLTDADKTKAKKLFGSVSKAVEWAIDNKESLTKT
jgi:hypothetical protein